MKPEKKKTYQYNPFETGSLFIPIKEFTVTFESHKSRNEINKPDECHWFINVLSSWSTWHQGANFTAAVGRGGEEGCGVDSFIPSSISPPLW